MARFQLLAVPLLVVVFATSDALSEDAIMIGTSTPAALPVHDEAGFDWSGFYVGIYGGLAVTDTASVQAATGISVGVNAQFDFYLVGTEVSARGLAGGALGDSTYGQILGRAGMVASENAMIYAAAGYGIDLATPSDGHAIIGGGVEFDVSADVTVDARYLYEFPVDGGASRSQITFGANFHF